MQGNFLQLSNRVINLDAVSHIDLAYPRDQGGSCVRVWFNQQTTPMAYNVPNQPPGFIEIHGTEAQSFRRFMVKLADTAQLTVITEPGADAETKPASKSASNKG
jgi:hypothetical protein